MYLLHQHPERHTLYFELRPVPDMQADQEEEEDQGFHQQTPLLPVYMWK
jgi:hypothetical protein